ncbi:hypothetical protein PPL_02545 [Heterostelium album PN500]|uniref:Carbohydrate binding domain-containing protein n=1 Tax=Heterostelium pallidum (strain ATCC 26659 / Pp 5 / PN500) TaxID=670386 RepID=D3B2D4_HETP5|nr:hypothetical protein PPL_02545 [Heterostelium album PN500]EFA84509.1 hypothetical protein PPL_02545 [Heterostelium album PN500]|eukprot:XP_020436622.1 hypothetical protein PPL_02545 [Heterostelium album PN500]
MKIALALFVLMTVALSTAHWECGPSICNKGWTCFIDGPNHLCNEHCDDRISLSQTVINKWNDAKTGQPMVQVDVVIKNVGLRTVRNVIIDGDDYSIFGTQIWNVNRLPTGDLVLPSYQESLVPGQVHKFGYIARGDHPVILYVKNVIIIWNK